MRVHLYIYTVVRIYFVYVHICKYIHMPRYVGTCLRPRSHGEIETQLEFKVTLLKEET